jgi:flagellar basal-body rod protein FlgB
MSWMNPALMDRIEHFLDLVAKRQAFVVGNMANIDTPGFRTRDINFRDELRRAEMALGADDPAPQVREVRGLIERPDGNNVSIDRESMLLAQTQLEFRIAVQLLRNGYQRILSAIREGS